MWADNETTVDVLGFDYLVDTPEVVLEPDELVEAAGQLDAVCQQEWSTPGVRSSTASRRSPTA
jgi:hypothetical protein